MKGFVLSVLLVVWVATHGPAQAGEGSQPVIEEIQFEGNSVFPDDELRSALQVTKVGDPYIPDQLEHDLHVNVGALGTTGMSM